MSIDNASSPNAVKSLIAALKKVARRVTHCVLAFIIGLLCSISTVHADNRDEVVFFFNDALGSAVAAVSEDGDLCWSEFYTPYGDKTVNDDLVNPVGCGIVGEERGYTGHTEDVNSDLVYMQQRYYDPSIGRFLSIDPLDASPNDPRTYNRYAYANNNPYKYVDPDGESAKLVVSSVKIGYKSLKAKGDIRSVGLDELAGVVDDISTLSDGRLDWNDLGAISDLALGSNFSDGGVHPDIAEPKNKQLSKFSLKRLKRLINKLSDNERKDNGLSQEQKDKLERMVNKNGATLRNDGTTGVRGSSAGEPHVQTEGMGKSVDSRHIWTREGVE